MNALRLGYSPCPNDTFIFHALTHGIVDAAPYSFDVRLEDVETLNRLAIDGGLDVAKVSYGALPYLVGEYVVLRSGGAMGRGCGPLIVAKDHFSPDRLATARTAIPGRLTTANLLLRLFLPGADPGIEMQYDRIMPAVASGEVDAGLIIHESRFTYPQYGLVQLVDLGEWWERTTGSPIPLGAIVARRSLGETASRIEELIRESVQVAFSRPDLSADYVRRNAQEMSPEVCRQHIQLYVNDFSVDVGDEGERAVLELMRRAAEAGLVDLVTRSPFVAR
jgi:1,4-dihydroxy-6-naphthoate synthase